MKDIKVKDIYRNGYHFELFLVANRKNIYNILELRYGVSVLNGYYLDAISKVNKTELFRTYTLYNYIDKDITDFLKRG